MISKRCVIILFKEAPNRGHELDETFKLDTHQKLFEAT